MMSNLVAVLALAALSFTGSATAADCPAIYRRYSQLHTFCQPASSSCNVFARGVNYHQFQEIIKAHNKQRSKVATGQENTVDLPSAADMLEMVWDSELAIVAQRLMEQCIWSHDCNDCRLIQGYNSVGQNLYRSWTSKKNSSKPDWSKAVARWYGEVQDFDPSIVSSFQNPRGPPVIGHFTQVVWAKSFAVGCGYVAFPDNGGTTEMYACNYGPGGNWNNAPMYVEGKPCSKCPINTYCTDSYRSSYPGLCQIGKNKSPEYPLPPGDYLYQCSDFASTYSDYCYLNWWTPLNAWSFYITQQDEYVGIVLNGGESSVINCTKTIKATPKMCFTIEYRKGPNVAGELNNNKAEVLLTILRNNQVLKLNLPRTMGQRYMKYSMSIGYNAELQYALSFTVPDGAPKQFFEVTSIYATAGSC